MPKVTIKQDDKAPVPVEILATAIRDIAEGMRKIRNSDLNERALHLLVSNSSGVSQRDVKLVLAALHDLERDFLKKPVR